MKTAISPRSTGVAILGRLVGPGAAPMSPGVAEAILQWSYPAEDRERVAALSAKASEGTLTAIERAELEEYIRVDDFLAILHAKARASLATARPRVPDGATV